MDDLRRDVNEAFDKGQAELGDLAGVRERMLRGAYAGRSTRPGNGMQLAAGIAAILIAALVIATFVYVRAVSQPIPGGRPLNVPDSTPVILYHDPANSGQIDGITWDGRTSGTVGQGDANGGTSNPAGTLYSTSTEIRDRSGKAVVDEPGFAGMWADDERSYCAMAPAGGLDITTPAVLTLVSPGASANIVARIGTYPAVGENRPPPTVAACSILNDRAVVFQGAGAPPNLTVQDWVVQLSTGRILWTHTIKLPSAPVGFAIAATHDGQFVAESILHPFQTSATINGPDGSAVSHLASSVDAFSWDGSLAVTTPDASAPLRLIRWRDGAVLWSGPPGYYLRATRSEPGGTRVAIGLTNNLTDVSKARLLDLYVISADGRLVWSKRAVYLA